MSHRRIKEPSAAFAADTSCRGSPHHSRPSFDHPKIFPVRPVFEVITTLDPENCRCVWKNVDRSCWLLDAKRWQVLVEVVEDGRKKTRLRHSIVCSRTPFASWSEINGLRDGFSAIAQGLKTRSEEKNS
ncbi:hypothetical protein BDN67DRAFT_966572 [Paxillus ammoniavirescens]|nr:hypothetical protein BDN67DRAFT_966572 [Paxillus ammoniavirescens]